MKEVNGVSTVSDEIQARIEEILAHLSPEQANKVRIIIGENIECLVHVPELIFGSSSVFIQAGERASREELFCALTLSRALNGQFPD